MGEGFTFQIFDFSRSKYEPNAPISTDQTRKPPLISLAMLRRAIGDDKFKSLDVNEVSRRVYAGVLLKDDKKQGQAKNGEHQEKSANQDHLQEQPYTKKYWVHNKLNKNCLMVLASTLQIQIYSSDNKECWKWPEEEEPCYSGNETLLVAELVGVRSLHIKGKCNTIMLSPMTKYEVSIIMKMMSVSESNLQGIPGNLSLDLPDGNKQRRIEKLDKLERGKWTPIIVGKFETTPKTVGEISFSFTQTDVRCKASLCVKGFVCMPTTENKQPS